MLPGIAGQLLSESFLERQLRSSVPAADADARRRLLCAWRRSVEHLGPASSVRLMLNAAAALVRLLDFEWPASVEHGDDWASATLEGSRSRVALVATSWGARLDPLWRVAVRQALARGCRWAILFNGSHLRLVDAGRVFTRRFVECDLDCAVDDPRTFAALWSVFNASRFSGGPGGEPLDRLVAESERHAAAVCRSLRDGVLAASGDILGALVAASTAAAASHAGRTAKTAPDPDLFEQALTIVYRLLFLLFAEARGLVPLWHPVYRQSYSVEALRSAAERPERCVGLWDALRAIGRLAHAGCVAGDLTVTPFNGRLFAPSRTPLAERRNLDDLAACRAIASLSTTPARDGSGRDRIEYRDLGVEQLGAVYEALLDYEPRISNPPSRRGRPTVSLERGSTARKESASFYTPQPLAQYLVRATLEPLTSGATPEQILQLRIVDPAAGSGAFLVAACRFLANAYEDALVASGACHPTDLGEPERASIRRTIAERCLYGVDLNPTAVQLARLSLWLATLAADRPLTFLDHHLVVGDSLIGAWLSGLGNSRRRAPRRRRDEATLPLFDGSLVESALASAWPVRLSLATPDDTLEQVRHKERALAKLSAPGSSLSRLRQIADLWCAPWFSSDGHRVPPEAVADLTDAILLGRCALPPTDVARYLHEAARIAAAHRFLHWELEFPEVFVGPDGRRSPGAGFDAVIGNPPWDMVRADLGSSAARDDARERTRAVTRFTRNAGVYAAQSDGHANRYQLFTERAIALTKPGGRIGLVLPSGLAADHGSARLRRLLLSRCDVDAIVGFDNHDALFPIHRSMRFLLVTATAGRPTRAIRCRLGNRDLDVLDRIDADDRHRASGDGGPREEAAAVVLTPALLDRISGPDLAIPWFTSDRDLAIAERAAATFAPLGDAAGWNARFGRELNATDDRHLFRDGVSGGIPIVEGKQIQPFRVELAASRQSIRADDLARRFGRGHAFRARLAYRDVASATNRVTLVAAVLPAGCVSTHTVFCLKPPMPAPLQHLLCGLFNSLVVNFLVRLRVSTHVTTAIVERLPIPRGDDAPAACRDIAALARLLSRGADPAAFARLNAIVARLYQLTATEFEHVVRSFPLIPEGERRLCLAAYATEAPPA